MISNKSQKNTNETYQLATRVAPLRSVVGGPSTLNAHGGKGPSTVHRSVDVG